VLHIANPVPGSGKMTYESFVEPAIVGTKSMIAACEKNKVKSLIITSSVVA
jgi:nucleoside-diphosphate-sugar epimerase